MVDSHQLADTAPAARSRFTQGGITLSLDAGMLLGSPAAMDRFLGQLVDLVARERSPAVRIRGLGTGSAPARRFVACCERLAAAFLRASLPPDGIELTIPAASLPPDIAFAVRSHLLGPGRLNLLLDRAALAESAHRMTLWRLRNEANIRLAFWPVAASGCPLVTAERALDIMPVTGLQVPLHSAWQVVEFDVGKQVDLRTGRPRRELAGQVAQLVGAAEERHDAARWPTAAMRQDAWLQRRVAILLTGIGDAVRRCGMDPADHATLHAVRGWTAAIREAALRASCSLARQRGVLPSLTADSPCRRLGESTRRDEWERKWLRAVSRTATRHRNLVAISPWSLLPSASAEFAYVNLLPVLADADVCAMRREVSLANWNVNKFSKFYESALAILDTVAGGVVVAEGL